MPSPVAKLLLSSLAIALLGACSAPVEQVAPPASRPVKIFTVAGGEGSALRRFPARIDAAQRAELAFRVSGQLAEIAVREGDLVQRGQLVARLDPTDYKIVLEDRQAKYDKSERNFARAKDLVKDGNISRFDYDRMEAEFRSASAALTQAKQDLEYTELRSPFAGRIASRLVENFEEVSARQTVFNLQSVGLLDVTIDLPESLLRSIRGNQNIEQSARESERTRDILAMVSFEDHPDQSFPLTTKELATKADEQTQTYRMTFSMSAPQTFTVLPGMTAQVEVDFGKVLVTDSAKWVPARAVQADSGLAPRVWVLDPDTMTVGSRDVGIGRMSGKLIEISSGLLGGEEIVAVGAPYLAEGMRVTRMAQTEQAVPRADDPA